MEDKNKIIKKSLNIIFKNEKKFIKSPNVLIKKKLVLIDNNNHPLKNLDNIVSPIKKPKDENNIVEQDLINTNDNDIKDKDKDNKDKTNIQLNNNVENKENINNDIEVKNLLFETIDSNSYSRNKELKSPQYFSKKYSIESFKKKHDILNDNEKENSFEGKKKYINKKNTTIYEENKNTFKLLPILNKNFHSAINHLNRLNKNIKSFKKETKIRTKRSQKKTKTIAKKYFDRIEIPTMRKTLRITKQRSWSKGMNKFIYENKKGHINFKFASKKKKKSPLTFVEEYNRMRNRRRKNNKKITSNIGFGVLSKQDIKVNKLKEYFGLSFNKNKYY